MIHTLQRPTTIHTARNEARGMEQTRNPDELLTVQEIAAELKINVETVRRWIRSRALPAAMLGSDRGGYRIKRRDLDAFLVTTFRQPGEGT